jgi:hypothetical protein
MNDNDIIGLTVIKAEAVLEDYDFIVREVIKDGESTAMTAEFRIDRVNVETLGGKIIRVVSVG